MCGLTSKIKEEIRLAIHALENGSLSDVRRHLQAALTDGDISGWQYILNDGRYLRKREETSSFSVYNSVGALKGSINNYGYYGPREILEGYAISPEGEKIPFQDFCAEQDWYPKWSNRVWGWSKIDKPGWLKDMESNGK